MHQLTVTFKDGSTQIFFGRPGELWRLRVKLLQASRLAPATVIREDLSTGSIEIVADSVWRTGRITEGGNLPYACISSA